MYTVPMVTQCTMSALEPEEFVEGSALSVREQEHNYIIRACIIFSQTNHILSP